MQQALQAEVGLEAVEVVEVVQEGAQTSSSSSAPQALLHPLRVVVEMGVLAVKAITSRVQPLVARVPQGLMVEAEVEAEVAVVAAPRRLQVSLQRAAMVLLVAMDTFFFWCGLANGHLHLQI